MPSTSIGSRLAALLVTAAAAASSATLAQQEVWVVNEGTNNLAIIDVATDLVSFFPFTDLDGDSVVESPTDICFSTLPSEPGTKAFITRGSFIEIWDVAMRAPVSGGAINVGGALGGELRGCDVAFTREFQSVGGPPELRAHLYVGLNQSGNANYVVFDQQKLLTAPPTAEVARGVLMSNAVVSSAAVLGLPEGNQLQRVWFGVSSATMAGGIKLTTDLFGVTYTIAEQNMEPAGGGGLFDGMDVHYSGCRELPIIGLPNPGLLENLELGKQCSIPGEPGGIEVTGPGPGGNTLFVADKTNSQLHIIDPANCDARELVPLNAEPVDVVTLGRMKWNRVYVANRGSDTLTYFDEDGDGTARTIFLSPMESTTEGNCFNCPAAMGVTQGPACDYKDLMVQKVDTDQDGTEDDIRITFDASSPSCQLLEAQIYCGCMSENCACECGAGNCIDPGRGNLAMPQGNEALTPDFPVVEDSAWIDLGSSFSPYTHDDSANLNDGNQAYIIASPD